MTLPKFAAAKFTAILVPLAYLVFYTPYGMDTTDFGYFYAYPWRILEGQIPYRDFFYIKPALPLYWHAFWLWLTPEKWQVLAGKAGFVVSMLASSWLGALTLGKMFNLRQIGLPLPLLATCGFVFGVHSFPHMPWHTVDGVLFSAAALWLASLGRGFPAGILAACALLCKQSFLPVPIAVLVLLWFWQKRRIAMVYCLAALFASLAAVHIFLYANDALAPMREMTTGQLDINEALDAGILIYFRQNFWLPLAACLPWLLGLLCKKRLPAWLLPPCCYMAILCVFYIYSVMEQKAWIGFGASWPTLLMLIGAMEIFFPGFFLAPVVAVPEEPHPMFRASTGLGALLAASWCVAISGGTATASVEGGAPVTLSLDTAEIAGAVAAGVADRMLVQVAYAIGVAEPVSIRVDTFGTGKAEEERIEAAVAKMFDLRPAAIIEELSLRRPIYRPLAAYGHMGREELGVAWEKTDKADALRAVLLGE